MAKMTIEEREYLNSVLSERAALNENWTKDAILTLYWSILDISSLFIPALKGLKGLKNTKVTLNTLKAGAKIGKINGKTLGKKAIKFLGLLIPILSSLQCMDGTEYTGHTFSTISAIKLPLIGTENLKTTSAKMQNIKATAMGAAGWIGEPFTAAFEYSDRLRNAARTLTQQMLKKVNEELSMSLQGEGTFLKFFKTIFGQIRNTLFNGQTDTEAAFFPEFIDLAKQKGIDVTAYAKTMAGVYVNYFVKNIQKQCASEQEFITLLRNNIINAANWYHLDSNIMIQAAFANLQKGGMQTSAYAAQNTLQQGVQQQSNPIIAKFQTWSQSMFKDNEGKPLQADGKIGPRTRNVIQQFQAWANNNGYANNMPVDGKWGPLTAQAFQNVTSGVKVNVQTNQRTSGAQQINQQDAQQFGTQALAESSYVKNMTSLIKRMK